MHEDATVVYSEIVAPGRAASGELFWYDICYLQIQGSDLLGALKFSDWAELEPKMMATGQRAQCNRMWSQASTSLRLLSLPPWPPNKYISTAEQLANAALADLKIRGGSSILPYSRGIAARMRGGYAGDLQRASCKIAEIIRKVVLGAPFTRMRKG